MTLDDGRVVEMTPLETRDFDASGLEQYASSNIAERLTEPAIATARGIFRVWAFDGRLYTMTPPLNEAARAAK